MSKDKQIASIRFIRTDLDKAKMLCRFYGFNSITELVNSLIADWLKDKEVIIRGK
jgi:hypothetical protein